MHGALLLKLPFNDAEAHAELASILLPPQASLGLFVSFWVDVETMLLSFEFVMLANYDKN